MSSHPTDCQGSDVDAMRTAIEAGIPDSVAQVEGAGGHFSVVVTSPAFAGKGMLACHRMVYATITHLMKGDAAPVHAVDSLITRS